MYSTFEAAFVVLLVLDVHRFLSSREEPEHNPSDMTKAVHMESIMIFINIGGEMDPKLYIWVVDVLKFEHTIYGNILDGT